MQSILERTKAPEGFFYDPSCILYLPLWKQDGASLMSRDHYGRLCTVNGAVWRPKGRYFDGNDDYITVPAASNLITGTNDFTHSIWTYPTNITGSLNDGLNWTTDQGTIYLHAFVSAKSYNCLQATRLVPDVTGAYVINVWQFFTITKSGTVYTLYKNGVSIATTTQAAINLGSTLTTDYYLGITPILTQDKTGLMGEVLVYNRGLTPLEIQQNYLATKWRYQ